MKIIGGELKGRNFYRPEGIRPTQSVMRKALFDILGHDLQGFLFLELFAGSGAIGLEAVSRGAREVVFVEKDPKCAQVIRENLILLGVKPNEYSTCGCEVLNSDAYAMIKLLCRQKRKFDIVFCDPPYSRGLAKKTLKTLEAYDIVQPNCTVVIQHDGKENLPDSQGRFLILRRRKYGHSVLSVYQKMESS